VVNFRVSHNFIEKYGAVEVDPHSFSFRLSRHFIREYGALEVDPHSFLSSALDGSGQLQGQPPFH